MNMRFTTEPCRARTSIKVSAAGTDISQHLASRIKEMPLSALISTKSKQPVTSDDCSITHGIEKRPAPTTLLILKGRKRQSRLRWHKRPTSVATNIHNADQLRKQSYQVYHRHEYTSTNSIVGCRFFHTATGGCRFAVKCSVDLLFLIKTIQIGAFPPDF